MSGIAETPKITIPAPIRSAIKALIDIRSPFHVRF